ncbi:MAG: hypothetical protein ACYC9O_16570 [Candidatus Latescibacterota bacterium]
MALIYRSEPFPTIWGWSFTSQKLIRETYEQNPKFIEQWLTSDYPAIQVRARKEHADISWGDETGISCTAYTATMVGCIYALSQGNGCAVAHHLHDPAHQRHSPQGVPTTCRRTTING